MEKCANGVSFCSFLRKTKYKPGREVVQIMRDMVAMEKCRDFVQDGLYEKVDVSVKEEERGQITGKQVCQFLLKFDKI